MKKTLLSLALITLTSTAFANEPIKSVENTAAEANQNTKTFHGKNHLPLNHQKPLLDITITSNNPEETIKKITTFFPEEKGKQYSVHVSITELPELNDNTQKPQTEQTPETNTQENNAQN